jgi:DNA-binding IclR family transcriptional regulator
MWARQAGSPDDVLATPAQRQAFDATLAEIRARGLERSIDAPSPAVSSMSAPVLDANGQLCLALTVIGSTGSIDVKWNGPIARALRETTQTISAELVATP